MLYRQHDLRHDLEIAVDEHVQGVSHHAFSGVFHRHHTIIRPTLAHLGEHVGDRLLGGVLQTGAKASDRCLVREGRFRSQIGNLHRFFQG